MNDNMTVGVDLSKNILHVLAMNHRGKELWRKKVTPHAFKEQIIKHVPVRASICVESCSTAHYWSRELKKHGYKVSQIPPQYVKPYVKTNKNDYRDAEAIAEAGMKENMRFVSEKGVGQQELQAMHAVRTRLVGNEVALMNQIRGLLLEHGVRIAVGKKNLDNFITLSLADNPLVSPTMQAIVNGLYSELLENRSHILSCEDRIELRAEQCPVIQRLMTIPGIGIITASALTTVSGDPTEFSNGRNFAAFLGLTPKQSSTGGKSTLLGISKRGNPYLRRLLISGAHSLIRQAKNKTDAHSLWIQKLYKAKGTNLTAVAVANKNARIAWRILTSNEEYNPKLTHTATDIQ